MRTLIAIVFVLLSTFCYAQRAHILVEGASPSLYISHVVAPKESYYSVARLYNLVPGAIAGFNGSNLQTGLKIGQTIKIPLSAQNFNQAGIKDASETMVPVYHIVAKNETLFRIGNNHNQVPLTSLREWNNLVNENLELGTPLIVGHLKIKNEQLPLLNVALPASTSNIANADVAVAQTPVNNQPKENTSTTVASTNNEEKKPEVQPATPIIEEKKAEIIPADVPVERKANIPEKVEVKKPATPVETTDADEKKAVDLLAPTISNTPNEGFFAAAYASDIVDKTIAANTGQAATFKSTSGWQNKKYYALMNNVEPGTIVKITSADKTVYAKVLGSIPDMKSDSSLLLRLSNAAASYLGKVDPKFPVQVSYYQ